MKNIAIKENHLYNKAYQRGQRSSGKYTSVYLLRDYAAKRIMKANPQKKYVNRLGIAVSKKIGGAVQRNRAKRIIRAAYRNIEKDLKTGYLVVISARPAINGMKSTDIEKELRKSFEKLNMFIHFEIAGKISVPAEEKNR